MKKVKINPFRWRVRYTLCQQPNQPKEMLPIVDKPLIQYAVEGRPLLQGVTDMIFVTGRSKRADRGPFRQGLRTGGGTRAQEQDGDARVRAICCRRTSIASTSVRPEPLGLGRTVLCAKPVVGDEPFAVLLDG